MKYLTFLIGCLFYNCSFSYSQTSHTSGYYDKDSVYFEVFWAKEKNQTIEWSVNNSSENSFLKYTDGLWLKNRDYTVNTWENIHVYSNNGFVHPIKFTGSGINDIIVCGKNNTVEFQNFRIEVNKNQIDGDFFNIYKINADQSLELEEELQLFKKSLELPYVFESGDGWNLESNSYTNHNICDYWDIKINPNRKGCDNNKVSYETNRGKLKKVNTIKVRLVDTVNHSIDREEVYIIGIGKKYHDHHLLFVTVDSSEIIKLLSNSSENLKVKSHLLILNQNGLSEFSDFVELDIASGSSNCFPNKGMAFKAKCKYPINGSKEITTTLFSDTISEVNKIKFRVGGTGQIGSFSSNEIILKLLNINSQKIGGVNSSYATLYLNGSYWSFGFPQEQPRKEYYSKLLKIDDKEINIANSFKGMFIDTIFKTKDHFFKGNYVVFSEDLSNSENYPFAKREMFIPKSWLKSPIIIFNKQKNNYQIIASTKDGNSDLFVNVLQEIMNLSAKSEDINTSYTKLNGLIDVKNWCKYFTIIHFLGKDFIDNNLYISLDLKNKLFPILLDFDDLIQSKYNADSAWKNIFNEPKDFYEDITNKIAVIINKSNIGHKLLLNTYSELLQNEFTEVQINRIVNSTRENVMKEYDLFHKSWGGYPNGGIPTKDQEILFDLYLNTLIKRTNEAKEFLNCINN
jgi:hypothetical protein